MSTISKKLSVFLFNGANVTLASAPFKNKLNAVYGFNASGTGYTVFKPASTFNSLTQLVQDGGYIVDAAILGFELPGAVLQADSGQTLPNPLSIRDFGVSVVSGSGSDGQVFFVYYTALTSLLDSYHLDRIDYASVQKGTTSDQPSEFNDESHYYIPLNAAGEEVTLTIRDTHGNKLVHIFTLPTQVSSTQV